MKTYHLNENYVATNPDKEIIFKSDKFYCEINLAEHQGVWAYGHELAYDMGYIKEGSGSPCVFQGGRDIRATRAEAKEAAITEALLYFQEAANILDCYDFEPILSALKKELPFIADDYQLC